MKQIKLVMLVSVAITIFSCYSINTDCIDCDNDIIEPVIIGDIIWERTGDLQNSSSWHWFITIDPNNGNIWITNIENELYLSTNNGDTWVKKGNFPFNVNSININPTNGHLFLGTTQNGLYRSTDNGENWKNIIDSVIITDILFTVSGEIYVGTYKYNYNTEPPYEQEDGFYYSNDNGNTWTNKIVGLPNPNYIWSLALGKDGTLYAGPNDHGVHRSTDGGVTWLPPSNYNDITVHDLLICDDGSIFAVSANVAGILKSTDKGLNWNKVNTTGFDNTRNVFQIISNPVTKDIFVINADDCNHVEFHTHHIRVYRSTDLGKSWILENKGLPNEISVLAVNPNTGQMFIGTASSIYRTKNYPK